MTATWSDAEVEVALASLFDIDVKQVRVAHVTRKDPRCTVITIEVTHDEPKAEPKT